MASVMVPVLSGARSEMPSCCRLMTESLALRLVQVSVVSPVWACRLIAGARSAAMAARRWRVLVVMGMIGGVMGVNIGKIRAK